MANTVSSSIYFSRRELECRHTGLVAMDEQFMYRLDDLRQRFGKPLKLSSAYRDVTHPAEAGKSAPGWHTRGQAVDILVHGQDALRLLNLALVGMFKGVGIQQKGNLETRYIHLDGRDIPAIWTY